MKKYALFLCIALTGSGCGNLRNLGTKIQQKRHTSALNKLKKTSADKASEQYGDKVMGEVAYVDKGNSFLLIKPLSGYVLPADLKMECRRGKKGPVSGNVQVTIERKSGFVAADIQSGSPVVGDFAVPVSGGKKRPQLVAVAAPAGGLLNAGSNGTASPGSGPPASTMHVDAAAGGPESMMRSDIIPDLPIDSPLPSTPPPEPVPDSQ